MSAAASNGSSFRRLQIKGRAHHDHHIGAAHDDKVGYQAILGNQKLHYRTGNKTGKAKAHDGQACCQAAIIREPFNKSRNRRDITRAQANAANYTVE